MQANEPTGAPEPSAALRRARTAISLAFLLQGLSFAALLTRIPELQRQYGLSDTGLTLAISMVPLICGLGSVLAERLAAKPGSRTVLRIAQPLIALSLI